MALKPLLLVLTAITTLLLSSCSPRRSSILTDRSCEPPCWHEIEPGRSTITQSLSALLGIPEVDSSSIDEEVTVAERGFEGWLFRSDVRESSGRIQFRGDVVMAIRFHVGGALNMAELVQKLGEPELVSVISGWADTRWLRIALLYPSRGFYVEHFNSFWWPGNESPEIRPDLPVEEVVYFDPSLYDELLRSRGLILEEYEVILRSLQPWAGFGETSYLDLSQRD